MPQKALSTPLVIERLNAGGTEVFWSGPQAFLRFRGSDWSR